MANKLVINKLIVKKSPIHGYGVFADTDIQPNEIIEECYTLTLNDNDDLNNYLFSWKDKFAIPLGFGCIYNHAPQPNAKYTMDENTSLFIVKANRLIKKGEEIFISYGKDWFDCRNMEIKKMSWLQKSWRYCKGYPLRAFTVIGFIYLITAHLK